MKTPYLDTEIELLEGFKDNKEASFYQLRKLAEYREIKQLLIQRVSCSFADKEILSNSLRFALTETPTDEQGALKDFKKYQALMRKCMLWLKDNYEPPCDGFMNECEA